MLFNRPRAERIMARLGVDALVASSPENVMYATDYECITHWGNKGFQLYSVFAPGHAPAASLIAPSLELDAIVDGDVWVEDVYLFSPFPRGPAPLDAMDRVGRAGRALEERARPVASALDGLVAALEARGLARGRIAVDETGMTPLAYEALKARLPGADLVPGGSVWWEIRMVKTAEEIRRLAEASRITEDAINEAFRLLAPGVTERALIREYHRHVVARDGRPTFMVLGSGSRTGYPHILPSDKVVRAGEVVRHDIGCTYRYYHSDTARAVVLGTPTADQQRTWDALCQGVEDAIASIRPGVDVKDLWRAAMRPGQELGLANFHRFHCGHGIGIAIYDPPVVTTADSSTSAFLMPSFEGGLEPDMVINVEVGYYVQGVQGFLCEDTLLVTPDGCDRLTKNSKALAYDDYMATVRA